MSELEPIGGFIKSATRRAQIQPQVSAAQALELFKTYVGTTLGQEATLDVRPTTIKNGTLFVFVRSGALLSELRLHEADILRCLKTSGQKIHRIYYKHE